MACNNQPAAPASVPAANELEILHDEDNARPAMRYCYELRTGAGKKQDVTSIWIEFTGDTVSGTLDWVPYEKDAALGTLTGIIKDSIITCKWQFEQEGMENETELIFRLSPSGLYQKEQSWDEVTGEPYIKKNAPFTTFYPRIDCNAMEQRGLIRH